MIIHTAILHLIAILIATHQHQIVQMTMVDTVVAALFININTVQAVNSRVEHDYFALTDVGTVVVQPIQVADNMIDFDKRR